MLGFWKRKQIKRKKTDWLNLMSLKELNRNEKQLKLKPKHLKLDKKSLINVWRNLRKSRKLKKLSLRKNEKQKKKKTKSKKLNWRKNWGKKRKMRNESEMKSRESWRSTTHKRLMEIISTLCICQVILKMEEIPERRRWPLTQLSLIMKNWNLTLTSKTKGFWRRRRVRLGSRKKKIWPFLSQSSLKPPGKRVKPKSSSQHFLKLQKSTSLFLH